MAAAVLLVSLADEPRAQNPQFDPYTDWTVFPNHHIPQCLPPDGEKLRESCCENYADARASQDEAGLVPYYSFARLDIRTRIIGSAMDGLPIPDTTNEAGLFREVIALIDRHCEKHSRTAYFRVMSKVWHDLPKPVETTEMAAEDLNRLSYTLLREPTEGTK